MNPHMNFLQATEGPHGHDTWLPHSELSKGEQDGRSTILMAQPWKSDIITSTTFLVKRKPLNSAHIQGKGN